MAEELGTAVLDLETDQTKLDRQLAGVKGKAGQAGSSAGASFKKGITRATLPAAAALGAVALGARKVINSASDLFEAQSAVKTIFGESADEILRWSQSTEDAFSQVEFLSAAKTFAGFGQAAGLAGGDLNTFSKDLIDAAADLASFHNVSSTQALDDLRSGLAGETEPLRKYNILLNDAALRQEAMRQGLIKNTKDALSPQNKVLATQALILDGLGAAQGDYKRTADGAANTERRQAANAEDLNAKIGKGLLPAYQSLQAVLLGVTDLAGKNVGVLKILTLVVVGLAAGVLLVNAALKLYAAGTAVVTAATWLWNAALAANPIVLVIISLVAVGVALVVAYKKFEAFRNVVNAVFNWVKSHWPLILAIIAGPIGLAVLLVIRHFNKIKSALQGLLSSAKRIAGQIGTGIKNAIVNGVKGLGSALASVVRAGINVMVGALRGFGIPGFKIDPPGPGSFSFPGLHPFSGIPFLDRGGVMPGPVGVHSLAWVAGGETILPTHKLPAGLTINFSRYSGTRRELIADIKAGLGEYRRSSGVDPW